MLDRRDRLVPRVVDLATDVSTTSGPRIAFDAADVQVDFPSDARILFR